jgi:transposase
VVNRIHKQLEDCNIKLSSVVSDVMGKSGRAMLEAMIQGEGDPQRLAELAVGRLREKIPQLKEALLGEIQEHHRFMLGILVEQVRFLEGQIGKLNNRIEGVMPVPFVEAAKRLESIPGIDSKAAQDILAELGADLKTFPSSAQLASWAGMCPGNKQSAGKRYSGKTSKGNKWIRVIMVQSAWGASRSKGTYLKEMYGRLAARRGRKKALIAVAHRLLVVIYNVLTKKEMYKERTAQQQEQQRERTKQRLLKKLARLGVKVTLQAEQTQASVA